MKKQESLASKLFDVLNVLFMIVLIIVMAYPMVYVFSASISNNALVASGAVLLWPKKITLVAYEQLVYNPDLWVSYWNTIRYTFVQTVLTLIATSAMAYPLAKRWLPGRRVILLLAAFTLLFSGGMIPTFLIVQKLGMLDTIWAIVLPSLISTWYLFIMRTFFEALPEELEDAAAIDGCGSLQILVRIVLPLSVPVMVTIGLFTAVNQWNSFFSALIYLNDRDMYPLQIMMRNILIAGTNVQGEGDLTHLETLKYAMIMIGTLPILCVYPFIQKYFVQGTMIGGIKG
ncbi:binding-protein-dependent transport systems inner membrane component [Paenibacillus vortex V453]|jgi:putative aldouronate transport system permease protein|uniref:Binding-protein-dependent transport systems inner membrane component n=1 Tax=Paenibacillus vortex V453 TaxID=715225 RepID=A0A2R9SYC3_9BACL|nr:MULTISPECIES: carbohydrate ABC transporter permease [Paenibacillus]ANA81195.1 sugar ABC transporter permease [Paenibacillus glucanolyticus]AVV54688.1 carbohydrate ABC transporter permease [Paenibacillus glucanolyticus]AWP29332.1 sugar ABC transporter permease [Paenibacillus sp. Cedars]EFU42280.1 binding-protein-dependent transport systems inner membrane component [Paenibacillus vortex V453]ETT35781.1 binding-protein-dependent transport systems inner membrane component [Paenibacillus sp. FSL